MKWIEHSRYVVRVYLLMKCLVIISEPKRSLIVKSHKLIQLDAFGHNKAIPLTEGRINQEI